MSDTADDLKSAQRAMKYARKRRFYWSGRVTVIERKLRRADELDAKRARGETLNDTEYMEAWEFASPSGRLNLMQARQNYSELVAMYARQEDEAAHALAALESGAT